MNALHRSLNFIGAVVCTMVPLGCVTVRTLTASPDEYAAYRRTRIAHGLDQRVMAADHYLATYADGVFSADVQRVFDRAEPVFYETKRNSATGLAAYLEALPGGPHSAIARARLRELRARVDEERDLTRAASVTEARLSKAADERARVSEEFAAWVGRFADPTFFQSPMSAAPREVVIAWTLSLPAPVCSAAQDSDRSSAARPIAARRCIKILELGYSLPVKGTVERRQATMEVALVEEASGRPIEVTIGGPDLLARLEEARQVRIIEANDAPRRIRAIESAVDVVSGELERRAAKGTLVRRVVVAPVILDMSAGGVRIVARAAQSPGEDDSVTIRPEG